MGTAIPAVNEGGVTPHPSGLARVARVLAATAVLALVVGAWVFGVPSSGEFGYAETLVQAAVLALYVVGLLVSLRWLATGATVMAVTAVGVGALSAVQLRPLQGLLVALALFLPSMLLWWIWRRTRGPVAVSLLALGLATLLAAGWAGSDAIFTYFYGPKAPVSPTVALPADVVDWMWSGGLTPHAAVVVARLVDDEGSATLEVSSSDGADVTSVEVVTEDPAADPSVRRFTVTGLQPGHDYSYTVVVDGHADDTRGNGELSTPLRGTQSFSFTFGSCARLDSNAATYDAIGEADPLFHLVTGDFFYGDIADDNVTTYGRAYGRQLTPGAPAQLFRQVPVAYMWDDHDFGPNDANRLSPSRDAAWTSYRTYVPHYGLGDREQSGPAYQAFTIGRARFVLTDLRSERDPATEPDTPDKTMLGDEQRAWLENELLQGSRRYPVVFWVSSVPWIVDPAGAGDSWGSYSYERESISQFLDDRKIDNVVMLAGDAHMLAADDGTHSNYAHPDQLGFPVLQAAPIDQHVSTKGGPYSEGVVAEPGQFGLVTVSDSGGSVRVHFEGRNAFGETVLSYRWVAPAP